MKIKKYILITSAIVSFTQYTVEIRPIFMPLDENKNQVMLNSKHFKQVFDTLDDVKYIGRCGKSFPEYVIVKSPTLYYGVSQAYIENPKLIEKANQFFDQRIWGFKKFSPLNILVKILKFFRK